MQTAGNIIKLIDKAVDLAVMLVCLLMMFIGIYSVIDNAYVYQHASDRSLLYYKPELETPLAEEKKITENQVGWLVISDTGIDYPLMQGSDNFEYLNKDPYGEFSLSGSIFLDAANAWDFSDPYTLVYGHHMEHGTMFGALDRYLDKTYFDSHRTGTLVSRDRVYDIDLFAVTMADALDPVMFNVKNATIENVTAFLSGNALIYEAPGDGLFLCLSTCYGEELNSRLLVIGTITPRKI